MGLDPQPIPTLWGTDHTPDGQFVVLIKQTHNGTSVDFVSTDNAEQLGLAMRSEVKKARRIQNGGTGDDLVVPGRVMLGPDGQPLINVPPSIEVQEAMAKHADAAAEDAAVEEVMGTVDITPEDIAQEPDSSAVEADGDD